MGMSNLALDVVFIVFGFNLKSLLNQICVDLTLVLQKLEPEVQLTTGQFRLEAQGLAQVFTLVPENVNF